MAAFGTSGDDGGILTINTLITMTLPANLTISFLDLDAGAVHGDKDVTDVETKFIVRATGNPAGLYENPSTGVVNPNYDPNTDLDLQNVTGNPLFAGPGEEDEGTLTIKAFKASHGNRTQFPAYYSIMPMLGLTSHDSPGKKRVTRPGCMRILALGL